MMLPSIELLEEVLGRKVKHGEKRIALNGNNLTFAYADEDMWSDINIYELMYLMKEWSIKQGYIIVEFPLMVRTTNISTQQNKIFNYTPQEELDKDYLKPEYIFKAGEWILEESPQ